MDRQISMIVSLRVLSIPLYQKVVNLPKNSLKQVKNGIMT